MIPRVDWLSCTFLVGLSPIPIGPTYTQRVLGRIVDESPPQIASIVAASEFQVKGGKNFYRHWLHRVGGGCDIFSSPDREDALLELSGIGCAMIPDERNTLAAVEPVRDRITRLDLAADFLDNGSPMQFAARRSNQRFRRISTDRSDTGETVYIGSRSSDKFARVYRYAPPHPRAEYLRVEHVYKRKQAQEAARLLGEVGIYDAVIAAGNYYGWQDPLWLDAATHDAELSAWRPDRPSPDSVRWLLTQVIPAMQRMENDGAIENVWEFLRQHMPAEASTHE